MSRGVALSVLRALLRAEISDTQEANTAADLEYNYALANKQKDLANMFDWPFLKDRWDVTVSNGSRYVSLPTTNIRSFASTINFQRPVQVYRLFNSRYEAVDYGIGVDEYNCHNSDLAENMDPVQRWALDTNTGDTSNPDEFEIWPIPASAQTIRFEGQRNIRALATDTDKADLDDLLIVYFVAADYLARREIINAPMAVGKANSHLLKLRAGYPSPHEPIVFGRSNYLPRQLIRTIPIVATA